MDSLVGWNDELAALAVDKPEAGEQITITPGVDQGIDISAIAALNAQFYQTGSNLWIVFEDGAVVIVEGYFDGGTVEADGTPRSVIVDGETFTGEEFLTAFAIDDLPDEFAEGDVGAPETQQNGASFDDPNLGPLGDDPNGIGLLGNTVLSSTTNENGEESPAFEDTEPTIGAIETGALDEDALLGAESISITGALNVDFGANAEDLPDSGILQDAPSGPGNRSITFDTADATAAVPLESGGVPLTFALSEGDTVLTAFADGSPVFEVRLFDDGTGSYQFTLFESLDHPDATSEDDLELTFSFTATDSNGDAASGTFSVSVNDDVPEVSNPEGVAPGVSNAQLDEDDITAVDGIQPAGNDGTDPTEATGNLKVNFGADGFGSTAFSGAFNIPTVGSGTADLGGVDSGLTSDGRTVLFRVVDDGTKLEAFVAETDEADEEIIFDATLDQNSDAGYTVRLFGNIDHGENKDAQSINLAVVATDFDGDSVDLALSVRLTDDVPEVDTSAIENGVVEEEQREVAGAGIDDTRGDGDADRFFNRNRTTDETDGSLGILWGADDGDARSLVFDEAQVTTDLSGLSSRGDLIDLTFSDDGTQLTATADGRTVFTVTLSDDDSGSYAFTLIDTLDHPAEGEDSLALTFSFVATDSDGDEARESFDVDVIDDRPVVDGPLPIFQNPRFVEEEDLANGNEDGEPLLIDTGSAIIGQPLTDKVVQQDLNIRWGADDTDTADTLVDGILVQDNTNTQGERSLTFADNPLVGASLKSRGKDVTVQLSDDKTKIEGFVEGDEDQPVFTVALSDDQSGSYTFLLHDVLDHPTKGTSPADEDTIALRFDFVAKDGDGDTDTGSFTVSIVDDSPVIDTDAIENGVVEEEQREVAGAGIDDTRGDGDADRFFNRNRTTDETDGSLGILWGADDGDARSLVFDEAQVTTDLSGLSSRGDLIDLTFSDDGTQLTATADGRTVFTVTLSDDDSGSYAFTLIDTLDHPAEGEDSLALTFSFVATDSDGDEARESFDVDVIDDRPVVDGPLPIFQNPRFVEEEDLANGNEDGEPLLIDTGSAIIGQPLTDKVVQQDLNIRWGADDTDTADTLVDGILVQDNTNTQGERSLTFADNPLVGASLKSRGKDVTVQLSDDKTKIEGFVEGDEDQPVFTVALSDDQSGSYTFLLHDVLDHPTKGTSPADEDTIALRFDFVAKDGDGDTDTGSFTVGIVDDSPVVGNADNVTVSEAGTVSTADDDYSFSVTFQGEPYTFVISEGSSTFLVTGGAYDAAPVTAELVGDLAGGPLRFASGSPGNFQRDNPDAQIGVQDNNTVNVGGRHTGGNYKFDFANAADANAFATFVATIRDAGLLNELFQDNGFVSASGDLNISWGADDADLSTSNAKQDDPDGPGDRSVTFADLAEAKNNVVYIDNNTEFPLTSGGVTLAYALNTEGTQLTATADGLKIFVITLDDDDMGSYRFELLGPLDHVKGRDDQDLEFDVKFAATDADGDTINGSFEITVDDDVPSTSAVSLSVDASSLNEWSHIEFDTMKVQLDVGTKPNVLEAELHEGALNGSNTVGYNSNGTKNSDDDNRGETLLNSQLTVRNGAFDSDNDIQQGDLATTEWDIGGTKSLEGEFLNPLLEDLVDFQAFRYRSDATGTPATFDFSNGDNFAVATGGTDNVAVAENQTTNVVTDGNSGGFRVGFGIDRGGSYTGPRDFGGDGGNNKAIDDNEFLLIDLKKDGLVGTGLSFAVDRIGNDGQASVVVDFFTKSGNSYTKVGSRIVDFDQTGTPTGPSSDLANVGFAFDAVAMSSADGGSFSPGQIEFNLRPASVAVELDLVAENAVDFGADGPADGGGFALSNDTSALADLGLKSDGVPINYNVNGGVLTATAGVTVVFAVALTAEGKATFTQFETIDDQAGVT